MSPLSQGGEEEALGPLRKEISRVGWQPIYESIGLEY